MKKHLTAYNFHTICEGVMRPCKVHGHTVWEALADLREMLYDGETIVGWR